MSGPLFHMFSEAPRPVAPYSHAVEADGWVFLTGQIPNHPDDDSAPIPKGIEAQTRRTMDNLVIVLGGLGLDLSHVVAARVFLTRFEQDYEAMNTVLRGATFPPETPSGSYLHRSHRPRAPRAHRDRFHRPPA